VVADGVFADAEVSAETGTRAQQGTIADEPQCSREVDTTPADTVAVSMSDDPQRAVREAMLKILNRDSQLRRAYLQRRWQGLDD
jgi:hypothetical protein